MRMVRSRRRGPGLLDGRTSRRRRRMRCGRAGPRTFPTSRGRQRLTFARVGVIDPVTLDDYVAHGGYAGPARRLTMPPAAIVRGVIEFGAARSRRRGVPDRHQVEDGARSARDAEVRDVQCRRRRFGNLLRPHADGRRSVPARRRHDDRRHRGRRDAGLHLSARRIPARASRAASTAIAMRTRARLSGRRRLRAAAGASISKCASAPAPTSAAKKPRCWRASRASAARCASARRCRRSRASSASRRSSTT